MSPVLGKSCPDGPGRNAPRVDQPRQETYASKHFGMYRRKISRSEPTLLPFEQLADAVRSLRREAVGPCWLVVEGSALRRWPALRSPAPCRLAVTQRSLAMFPEARGRTIARSAVLGDTHDASKGVGGAARPI